MTPQENIAMLHEDVLRAVKEAERLHAVNADLLAKLEALTATTRRGNKYVE